MSSPGLKKKKKNEWRIDDDGKSFLLSKTTHGDDHADVGRRRGRLRDAPARGAHRARAEVASSAAGAEASAPAPIAAAAASESAAPAPAAASRLALLRRDDVVQGHSQACYGIGHRLDAMWRNEQGAKRRKKKKKKKKKKTRERERERDFSFAKNGEKTDCCHFWRSTTFEIKIKMPKK